MTNFSLQIKQLSGFFSSNRTSAAEHERHRGDDSEEDREILAHRGERREEVGDDQEDADQCGDEEWNVSFQHVRISPSRPG